MPLMSAPGRQKEANFCELEASLVYIVSSRPARGTQLDTVKKKFLGKLLSRQTQEQLIYVLVTVFIFFNLHGGYLS